MMIEELIFKIANWGAFLFCGWMIWRWADIQQAKKKAESTPEPQKPLNKQGL